MPKVYIGPYAKCSCCDKATPVRLCSVAGPIALKVVQIDHKLLSRIFQDVSTRVFSDVRMRSVPDASAPLGSSKKPYTYWRFDCLKCGGKSQELHWVEVSPGNWVGGWCKFCLHRKFEDGTFGHPEDGGQHDMNILRMSANKKVATTLDAWNEAWQHVKDVQESEPQPRLVPEEGQLF